MRLLLLVLAFITIPLSLKANVWESNHSWDDSWLEKYQEWIISDDFQKDFFTRPGPWQGLFLDCADAMYALRIIFSYNNKLPFKISSGLSNNTTSFDSYPSGVKRVRAFIDHISRATSASSLATSDTYPVAIKDIKAGDVYVTSWGIGNHQVRHSHMIKEVNPFGYFKLLFATTPPQNRNLVEIEGMPLTSFTGAPWGFKRFKLPQHYSGERIYDSSNEQYEALKEVGPAGIFDYIQKEIEQMIEGVGNRIGRQFRNICDMLNSRIEIVNEAQEYLKKIGNRCMNATEFDMYSTNIRDLRIKNAISMLVADWKKLSSEGGYHDAYFKHQLAMDYLIDLDFSQYAKDQLLSVCSIKYIQITNI